MRVGGQNSPPYLISLLYDCYRLNKNSLFSKNYSMIIIRLCEKKKYTLQIFHVIDLQIVYSALVGCWAISGNVIWLSILKTYSYQAFSLVLLLMFLTDKWVYQLSYASCYSSNSSYSYTGISSSPCQLSLSSAQSFAWNLLV